MPNTTAMANSFKQELLAMNIHAATDVYKICLIKAGASGTYGASTTSVGTPGTGVPVSNTNLGTDEVTGTGYTTGGATLTGFSATLQSTTGVLDFASAAWPSSNIAATGAIIYNSSKSNRVVAVYDFGGTITSSSGTFTAAMPAVGAGSSLIRIA